MRFDRVATRYGPSHDKISDIILGSAPRRMHFGDYLLEIPVSTYDVTLKDSNVVRHRFDAAHEAVEQAARKFYLDRPSLRDKKTILPKQLYLGALMHSDIFQKDSMLSAPEDWLRRHLKRGETVTYDQSDGISL